LCIAVELASVLLKVLFKALFKAPAMLMPGFSSTAIFILFLLLTVCDCPHHAQ
jgi:sterol desaturase/sphingolipid hydroxylase (fatty acid hydroxylase superfamily)